ncbi:MAG: Cytochrome bd-II ubiquinol oxidase subunit 1 [Chlamydiia bacterium]|nr:Cytochrome bd-II ubiquinol oxidase subunit 1 [Chlamydiia bacterium]
MDVTMLSRIQFAMNITFHYLFPPMTIGLAWVIILMEGLYLKTKNPEYYKITRFLVNIFGLFFAMGVATGFIQVFAFGNNWSQFSKFVGNVFGSLLAAEGVFAFFMEAGFLGIMIFGWTKVKPKTHYLATIMVGLGATFSATWIVMANSWMQTPAGYKIIGEGIHRRAVITDLWQVYFSPSFLTRLGHVLLGCFLLGIFFVVSISAYYVLKKKHQHFGERMLKGSLITAFVALILQLWSADSSAKGVARDQPTKFAAMEAVFNTEKNTPMSLIGIVDMKEEKVYGIAVPSLLSLLTYHNLHEAVPGLNNFPKKDWPHVPSVFYSYRAMIYAWSAMILIALLGLCFYRSLEKRRWFLWISVYSIIFPYVGNIAGWFTAELGRQPWIVYNVMRTSEGVSRVISRSDVIASISMFAAMYTLMLILFLYLLNKKIQKGPVFDDDQDTDGVYKDPFLELNQE